MLAALKEKFRRFLTFRSDSAPVERHRASEKRKHDDSMDDEVDDADTAVASNSRKRFCADDTRLPNAGRSLSVVAADAFQSPALPLVQPSREQMPFRPIEWARGSRPSGHASRPSLLSVERLEHHGTVQNNDDGLGNPRSATAAHPSQTPALPLAQPSRKQTASRPLQWPWGNRPSGHALRPWLWSVGGAEHGEPVQNDSDGLENSRRTTAADPCQRSALPLAQPLREQTVFPPLEQSRDSRPSGRALRPSLLSVERLGYDGHIQNLNDYSLPGRESVRAVQPVRSLLGNPDHSPVSSNEGVEALSVRSGRSIIAAQSTCIRLQEERKYQSLLSRRDATFSSVGTKHTNCTEVKPMWPPTRQRSSLLLSRYQGTTSCSVSTTHTSRTEAKSMWLPLGQRSPYATVALEPPMRDGPAFSSLFTNYASLTKRSVAPTILSQPVSCKPIPVGDSVTLDAFSPRNLLSPTISMAPVASPLLPVIPFSHFYSRKWMEDLKKRLTYMDQSAESRILFMEQSLRRHNTFPVPVRKVPSVPDIPVDIAKKDMFPKLTTEMEAAVDGTFKTGAPDEVIAFQKPTTKMDATVADGCRPGAPDEVAAFPNLTTEMEAAVDDAVSPGTPDEVISFPKLTAEMEAAVDDAFRQGALDEVIVRGFGLSVMRKDIKTLADLNWLNDKIINFYMNMLVERNRTQTTLPSVYAFSSFFYPKLCASGYDAVKHWTRHVDIFAHDLILVPVLLDLQWCLAVVDFKFKTISYYNSLGNADDECFETLCGYLEEESKNKRQEHLDVSNWTLDPVQDIPYQLNFNNSGMFVLKSAEYIARGAKLTFSQQYMPYYRKCVAYEILTKKFL